MDTNDIKNAAAGALLGGALLAANVASAAGATNASFFDANGNEINRTKCEIYTRVMGYYRPVSQFNNGKKSEFYSRKYFDECKSANSKFMEEFGGEETGGK